MPAVESVGDLPMGGRAAILRGVQRGRVGAAVASEQGGLWVNVEPVTEGASATPIEEPVRELRAVLQNVAELRNSRRLPEILRTMDKALELGPKATAREQATIKAPAERHGTDAPAERAFLTERRHAISG